MTALNLRIRKLERAHGVGPRAQYVIVTGVERWSDPAAPVRFDTPLAAFIVTPFPVQAVE